MSTPFLERHVINTDHITDKLYFHIFPIRGSCILASLKKILFNNLVYEKSNILF